MDVTLLVAVEGEGVTKCGVIDLVVFIEVLHLSAAR